MLNYNVINKITGWIVFGIASAVYLITSEPTTSFWDCGEYISTAFKLQVGHPPGAPFFQLAGRVFSLFALGDTSLVARMVNSMSALSSSFTILFLFWTITILTRKIIAKKDEITKEKLIIIMGSGLVGSLAYTFSDSFWFSATEGEVYAMSSFFTAIVFWAILKWEENADSKNAFRWIILIAYLVGLSIGVHLLNLLAIPAIALVFYFRKYKYSHKGLLLTLMLSLVLLALVMYGIIPWVVKLAGYFELALVNGFGLPFHTGTIVYFILLIAGLVWGLHYTAIKGRKTVNIALISLTFILMGYSSFFLLIIRSNANPPINENSPRDAISLLAYLNREQYGDWPVLKGQYYNAPVVGRKDGKPVYRKDSAKGRYIVSDDNKNTVPVFDPQFTTIFPRMWNNSEKRYINDYKTWGKVKGIPVKTTDEYGEEETLQKPTFRENLRFFFRYQLNHMYFRYFMWNFSGRQDDIQGMANRKNGNWITGIRFLDEKRLGPIYDPPASLKNKAINSFYLLPLLLGLAGILMQFRKDKQGLLVVAMLFIMTGIAIVVYLNQHAPQPRERDYANAASFYAFAIWIGIGVAALYNALKEKTKSPLTSTLVTAACLLLVPVNMAKEGWDDHNRAGRFTALAIANNYLNSCAPNAILFTNGDNDTFPLWYAQEVEGIRTDVRVVNLSLLNTGWYIDQMKRKVYDSDPLPISLPEERYRDNRRNYTYLLENENVKGHLDLRELFDIIIHNESTLKLKTRFGEVDYFPSKKFRFPVDSAEVVSNGTVPAGQKGNIVKEVAWTLNRSALGKNDLMILDILATNQWKRPVYFAITTGNSAYIGLESYFQLEGLAYRLVPVKNQSSDGQAGRVEPDVMFDNLMNKFTFGNMDKPEVYLDETTVRMSMNLRNNFYRLADALIRAGRYDSAVQVIDRCLEVMPDETVPYNLFTTPMAEGYYETGNMEKANRLALELISVFEDELEYYFRFEGTRKSLYDGEKQQNLAMLQRLIRIAGDYEQEEVTNRAQEVFDRYYGMYIGK
ncbi:MAG: DUF2723 domain-containing protein [Bacteroidales bacterium]|nr:DUF2723 domain-containing protein [Bacteroidales bacterium]